MILRVVILHAVAAYTNILLPDLLWTACEASPGVLFDLPSWWIEGFAMPVFFLISGFWGAMQYASQGPAGFLTSRARRLLLPFLAASLVILPLTYYVWSYGWFSSGKCTLEQVLRVNFSNPEIKKNLYGPAHLWFLEYLMILSLVFLPVRHWAGRFLSFRPHLFFFIAATAAVLYFSDLGAMFNLRNSFVPAPARLLHYGIFFFAGTGLYPVRADLRKLTGQSWLWLGISFAAFAIMAPLLRRHLTSGLSDVGCLLLASSAALFSWSMVWGLLGLSLKYLNRENNACRYVWEASYWVYLCHFPLVGLMQIVLLGAPLSAILKFFLVAISALTAGLLSYRFFVRGGFIGVLLGESILKGRQIA